MLARQKGALAMTVTVRPRGQANADRAASPVHPMQAMDDPWWPGAPLPARPLIPPPGSCNFGNRTEAQIVACSVMGLRGRDLEAAVSAVW